jgi:hypothetical protein
MKKLLDTGTLVLVLVLLVGFAVLALGGLVSPERASARFGIATADPAGLAFYRVYLSRNLVIVLCGLTFLVLGEWRSLAILMTVAAMLPLFDIGLLALVLGQMPPAFHFVALTILVLAATLVWRRAIAARGRPATT